MFLKNSFVLLIYFSIHFIFNQSISLRGTVLRRHSRQAVDSTSLCTFTNETIDQVIDHPKQNNSQRSKRFVLFPEFELYRNQFEYVNRPSEFSYWITNYYPNQIDSEAVARVVEDVIRQINEYVETAIIIKRATHISDANFHYVLFDYAQCPIADPNAALDGVQSIDRLIIYEPEVVRTSKYRAHGGIIPNKNGKTISVIKLNIQQTFIVSTDYVYDHVTYHCNETENRCKIDLYFTLLHETLHGFGIEHTTNSEQPNPPNPDMKAVMHFLSSRVMCHDDIRAIRAVYNLKVIRSHSKFDDTCRRDFPMNYLQKLFYKISQLLVISVISYLIVSCCAFFLTLAFLFLHNRFYSKAAIDRKPIGVNIKPEEKSKKKGYSSHGYLYHDEIY